MKVQGVCATTNLEGKRLAVTATPARMHPAFDAGPKHTCCHLIVIFEWGSLGNKVGHLVLLRAKRMSEKARMKVELLKSRVKCTSPWWTPESGNRTNQQNYTYRRQRNGKPRSERTSA